ncbi:MAG TPA: radical SAM protein [bacterium]|jgi:radical SAM superfamily enzyme YgiQ (UPF0313 family)
MFEAYPITKEKRVAIISLSNPFNIGARHLNSVTKVNGYDSHMIFVGDFQHNDILPPSEEDLNMLIELIQNEIKPDVLGISVSCSSFYKAASWITTELKNRGFNGPIAWGGIHGILCPEECVRFADIAFTGEAENDWTEFLHRVETGQDWSDLGGTWTRDAEGNLQNNGAGDTEEDLDTVPFPDYDNDRKYLIKNGVLDKTEPFLKQCDSVFVLSSRGCPFHCTFCASPLMLKDHLKGDRSGKFVRQRTVNNVIGEIKYIEEAIPNFAAVRDATINFGDDVFVLKIDWVREFTKAYYDNFTRPYWCYFHPNTVKKDIVETLAQSGLKYVDMGVQSGSERIRTELFDRTDNDKRIQKAVNILHDAGVNIVMDVITDNPFDTEEDKKMALEFFLSLKRPFMLNYLSMIMFPKVRFTDRAMEAGLINENDIEQNRMKVFEQWETKFDWPKRDPDELFWISLFTMTGKKFVPKSLLRTLPNIKFLRRNPAFVVWLAKRASNVVWFQKRLRIFWTRLWKGEVRTSDIMYSLHKYRRMGLPQE